MTGMGSMDNHQALRAVTFDCFGTLLRITAPPILGALCWRLLAVSEVRVSSPHVVNRFR